MVFAFIVSTILLFVLILCAILIGIVIIKILKWFGFGSEYEEEWEEEEPFLETKKLHQKKKRGKK